MVHIDAVGQPCPIPVVRAKQAIAALPDGGGTVAVTVDNRTAGENLAKLAAGSGYRHELQELPDGHFRIAIHVGVPADNSEAVAVPVPAPLTPPASAPGLVVAIGADHLGRGSEELGKILIKGFVFSLTGLDPAPQAVLFFNSGVRLVLADANTVQDVQALAAKGCTVLVCGTCVEYYQCRDRIAVGEITTMYGIVEAIQAGRTVFSV
ncbi:MAG: sulfurtransferase-like selenium metabolism protein YedF [Planctomycetes bacterium]|nr:sulfurtransferase-like selenium metabolism protein YedF [Planctomycetota bacterium]